MRCHPASVLLLAVLVVTALPAIADETVESLALTPAGRIGVPIVEIVTSQATGLTLALEIPSVDVSAVEVAGRSFRSLEFTDGGHRGAEGQPELPTITHLVALPPGLGATATLRERDMVSLGNMALAPNLPIERSDKRGTAAFSETWYRAARSEPEVMIGEPALLHGLRVVPVTFSPVAYDPATGHTEVARRMTVEIEFAGRDQRNNAARTPTMIPESFAAIYDEIVLGYEPDRGTDVGPGSYIMICPNNGTVVDIVTKLADWRRRQGYNVLLVTTATTGTTNSAIKSWLQQQYNTLQPQLEYVSLIGDANGSVAIPTWTESYSGYGGEGDHEYTLLDGSDPLPDIHIGRISVTSTAQLQQVIDKIVEYEANPYMTTTDWFTTAGLTGDPSYSGDSCIYVNQFVKEQLLQRGYTRVDTIWGGNFTTQMINTINQGETIFTYRGYLNMSGMSTSHIGALTNGQKLPYAVVMTCGTGSFQSETTCRSEAFLRAVNGGGIAAIGTATLGTHTRYNNCIFLGVMNGLINLPGHRTGPALTRGKINVYLNYATNQPTIVPIWSTWNNIMGDPATAIYTGVPAAIQVNYPAQVSTGANALPVTVTRGGAPLAGAWVAVYQAGAVQDFALSDAAGQAVLSIAGAATGDVLVTVTGTNLKPHLGVTAVGAVTRSLDFHSLTISEVSGNGDGVPNPSETLDLQVQLRNNGTSSVTAATAVLTSALPHVTVLNGTASYGTVAAGGTASGTFRVRIEADAPGGEVAALRLDATGSGQTWASLIDVPISGARGMFRDLAFSGPGGNLDPGESGAIRFGLHNLGNTSTAGVTGTMTCASQWVTVTDAAGAWGPIAVGNMSSQSDPFAISIAADCYRGALTSFVVTLTFAEGGTQVLEYPVVIGTAAAGDPTGPDAYGYWAFDNTDSDPLAPVYDWVEISPIGANTGINDNTRHADETRRFDLPFPFTYYGQTYNRVSICSNGWLALGNTYLVLYRSWVLPADGSPNAMVCAFWDDLAGGQVYTYHDAAQHRFIVQWEAFGNYSGSSYGGNCTFQIILYDPAHHATDTGDGPIVFQYKSISTYTDESTAFTTGIQDHTRTDGLTYAFGNRYSGGAASLQAGRAILFRPVMPQTQGALAGLVRNSSAGGAPIPGATVTVVGAGRQFATGAGGQYQGGVPIGVWDIAVWHASCAPDTVFNVNIRENETATADFDLVDIRGPYITDTTQIFDTDDTVGPYVIQSTVTDLSGVADRNLHYTISGQGGPYTLPMTVVDAPSGLVQAAIPGQPAGTRVQYWVSAADVVGNTSVDPAGAPWPPYSFMIGAETQVIEDGNCETATGWTVNLGGDDTATSGNWEHGIPIGTWQESEPVQPDADHTPDPGVNCWFTGQHVAGQSVGYSDVDNGHTTLTTPTYAVSGFSSVQVSYYRWFTNDLGNSPGEDPWTVDVSNDGGQSWTNFEYTLVSNNSWQPVSFVLNDYFPIPSQLRLRFRAVDNGAGSLVEAAVDDLRITGNAVTPDLLPPVVTVTGPTGGTYVNGQFLNITWNAADDVGVVHANVWLSLDGGATFPMLLAAGPLDGSYQWLIAAPAGQPSYLCRVRVEVLDAVSRSAQDISDADFTIVTASTDVPSPRFLQLAQNQPNPFNPQTVIAFDLPREQPVQLRVYDVQGKLVATLLHGRQAAGRHEVTWRGRDDQGNEAASGMYFYRLQTADGDLVRKMMLLK